MGRIKGAIGIVVTAFVLCAAGPYSGRLSPGDLRHIRTVAVISAVGHSFLFQHVSNKAFEWLGPPDSHFLEISDWALDPLVTREVTAALAKHFAIKPVVFEPADFSSWDYSLLRRDTLDLNVDPAIDAYVLILRDWRADEIGDSVHALGGLGLYRRDGGPAKYGVFASYRIVVVDAITGDTIASRAALLRDGALPWLPADPSLWPKTQNDLTDAQRATLQAEETKLIEATLLRTLAQMNLAR
ncbi:MAG: hypothetical protein ACLQUZ_19285 [Rhizomicrobium sp.]